MPGRGIQRVRNLRSRQRFGKNLGNSYKGNKVSHQAVVTGKRMVAIGGASVPSVEMDAPTGSVLDVENIGRPGNALYAPTEGKVSVSVVHGTAAGVDTAPPTDHGTLTGLSDDDHKQYVTVGPTDDDPAPLRTIELAHTYSTSGAPFILAGGSRGALVTGFLADAVSKVIEFDQTMVEPVGNLNVWDNESPIQIKVRQSGNFTWTGTHVFDPLVPGAPFTIGPNGENVEVPGLVADSVTKEISSDDTVIVTNGDMSDADDEDPVVVVVNVAHDFDWSGDHYWNASGTSPGDGSGIRLVDYVTMRPQQQDWGSLQDPALVGQPKPWADGTMYFNSAVADVDVGSPSIEEGIIEESVVGPSASLMLYDYTDDNWGMVLNTAIMPRVNATLYSVDTHSVTNTDTGLPDLDISAPGGFVLYPDPQTIRTPNWVNSPAGIRGWRIWEVDRSAEDPGPPFIPARSSMQFEATSALFDNLKVRTFIADTIRVNMGEEWWSRGRGVVETDFPMPSEEDSVWAWFEAVPELGSDFPIFQVGDKLQFRIMDWPRNEDSTSGFEYVTIWFFVVAAGTLDEDNMRQRYQIRRKSGGFASTDGMTVREGTVCVNFGQDKEGMIWLNALMDTEGEGPFMQMGYWQGGAEVIPADAQLWTTRQGNLSGILDNNNTDNRHFGFAAAANISAVTEDFQGVVIHDSSSRFYNSDIWMHSGSAWRTKLEADGTLFMGQDVDSNASGGVSFFHAGRTITDMLGVSGKDVGPGDSFMGNWLTEGQYVHFEAATGTLSIKANVLFENPDPGDNSGLTVQEANPLVTGIWNNSNIAYMPISSTAGSNDVTWANFTVALSTGEEITAGSGSWPVPTSNTYVLYVNPFEWMRQGKPLNSQPVDVGPGTTTIFGIRTISNLLPEEQPLAVFGLGSGTSEPGGDTVDVDIVIGKSYLSGYRIITGSIHANRITANTITANEMYAQLVFVRKGIVLGESGDTGHSYIRSYDKTGYGDNQGKGYIMGQYLGNTRFEVGDGNSHVRYDSTSGVLSIKGSIEVTGGPLDLELDLLADDIAGLDTVQSELDADRVPISVRRVSGGGNPFYTSDSDSSRLYWHRFYVINSSGSPAMVIEAGSFVCPAGAENMLWVNIRAWKELGSPSTYYVIDSDGNNAQGVCGIDGLSTIGGSEATICYMRLDTSNTPDKATYFCPFTRTVIGGGYIRTGSIIANHIVAGTITADKLTAAQVYTSQYIELGNFAYIKTAGKTGWNTGAGVWLGKASGTSSTNVFYVGSGGTNYISWNGSALSIGGTTFTNGNINLGSGYAIKINSKSFGSSTQGVFLGYDSTAYKFDVGDSNDFMRYDGTRFHFSARGDGNDSGYQFWINPEDDEDDESFLLLRPTSISTGDKRFGMTIEDEGNTSSDVSSMFRAVSNTARGFSWNDATDRGFFAITRGTSNRMDGFYADLGADVGNVSTGGPGGLGDNGFGLNIQNYGRSNSIYINRGYNASAQSNYVASIYSANDNVNSAHMIMSMTTRSGGTVARGLYVANTGNREKDDNWAVQIARGKLVFWGANGWDDHGDIDNVDKIVFNDNAVNAGSPVNGGTFSSRAGWLRVNIEGNDVFLPIYD